MEIIFPARLSGAVTPKVSRLVKVRIDGLRLRAWAQKGREVEQVLDVEGLSLAEPSKQTRILTTADGDVSVMRSGGCGCSQGVLRRFQPPDVEVP